MTFSASFTTKSILLAAALAMAGPLAFANEGAIGARQGQFKIMALNIGVLGGMARGTVEYDAAQAQIAADNLAAISQLSQAFNWPEGSDMMAATTNRAWPAIWENQDDFLAKWAAFGTAATGLQAAAGNGLEAMQAALGPVGGSCGACHDAYRQPQ